MTDACKESRIGGVAVVAVSLSPSLSPTPTLSFRGLFPLFPSSTSFFSPGAFISLVNGDRQASLRSSPLSPLRIAPSNVRPYFMALCRVSAGNAFHYYKSSMGLTNHGLSSFQNAKADRGSTFHGKKNECFLINLTHLRRNLSFFPLKRQHTLTTTTMVSSHSVFTSHHVWRHRVSLCQVLSISGSRANDADSRLTARL